MSFEEAVEALKARDPGLVVQLAELCAAVDASKVANDPTPAWDRMEAAIVALVKSTGADDELLERQFREGHDAAGAGARKTTREDLDNVDLRYADGGILSFRRRSPVFCSRCLLAWAGRQRAAQPWDR
jgi:hypothetical protein